MHIKYNYNFKPNPKKSDPTQFEYRVIYDREQLAVIATQLLAFEHPDWPYEKRKQIGSSEEKIQELIHARMIVDLQGRLLDDAPDDKDVQFYFNVAKRIMDNIQPELVQNINEWIDGEELTDIKIHGVSIKDIMTQFPDHPIHFVRAVECLIDWKKSGYQNKHFCRNYFWRNV